jgi:hypothetical protein
VTEEEKDDGVELRVQPDLRLVNTGLQRTALVGSLWIIGACVVVGAGADCALIVTNHPAEITKDLILPIVTGLLGIIGGIFTAGRSGK